MTDDPCPKNPCYNGGTCTVNDDFDPECECAPGYEGGQCEDGNI